MNFSKLKFEIIYLKFEFRYRGMYNKHPEKIDVEPRIKFKYMDDDGKTIDINHMNDSVKSNNSSKVSSNKSFIKYLMNQNTPPPKEVKRNAFILNSYNANNHDNFISTKSWF